MHDNLGDWAAQEAIRERTPDKQHCTLLMQAANACSYCPKNPFQKQERSEWREFAPLLEESNLVLRMIDAGFTVEPWAIPWDVTLASIVAHNEREKIREERYKAQRNASKAPRGRVH